MAPGVRAAPSTRKDTSATAARSRVLRWTSLGCDPGETLRPTESNRATAPGKRQPVRTPRLLESGGARRARPIAAADLPWALQNATRCDLLVTQRIHRGSMRMAAARKRTDPGLDRTWQPIALQFGVERSKPEARATGLQGSGSPSLRLNVRRGRGSMGGRGGPRPGPRGMESCWRRLPGTDSIVVRRPGPPGNAGKDSLPDPIA